MNAEKGKTWVDVLEALRMGCDTAPGIADMVGISRENAANYPKRMLEDGVISRVDRGRYAVVEAKNGNSKSGVQPYTPPARNGNGHGLAESDRRRVEMPAFLKQRSAITLFVEHSPQEIEGVMRFEIQMGGVWLPVPFSGDMRVCVGDDVPRWSANQETYNGVTAFRVTMRDGQQMDYAHNPQKPFTLDMK